METFFIDKFILKLIPAIKKNDAKGFTFVELLIVFLILGVLAWLALPNLLGCVGKSRDSEAKTTLGALNRAQQVFFTKKAKFATKLENYKG